tara:strand:+ start:24 stop:542 length:519 start_codon:yes stop_codon:yes gene_type:complete
MDKELSKSLSVIKYIGYYQILFGVIGTLAFLLVDLSNIFRNPLYILSPILVTLSFIAGVNMIKVQKAGLKATVVFQALQIISFATPLFAYTFSNGLFLKLFISESIKLNWTNSILFDNYHLTIEPGLPAYYLEINLIPIAIIYLANKYWKKYEELEGIKEESKHSQEEVIDN